MNAEEFISSFGYVANSPSGVARLRELVLHFAVSGKLVPYIGSEGHADDALAEAAKEKASYRERLKLRSSYGEKELSESDQAYELPKHWKWERLGNLACYIQRGKGPKYDAKGKTLVVSQKCIQWEGLDLSVARRVSDESQDNYGTERFLVKGDILWNSTGTGTAGRTIVYPGANEQVVADSHVTVIRLTNFVPAYIWCFLASPFVQRMMQPGQENSMVTGTTNQVELSTNKVFQLPIPCPPIKEQERIVAKVDELMALCDQLETQQQERQQLFPVLSRTCNARFIEVPTPSNLNRIFDETGSVSPTDLKDSIRTLAIRGMLVNQDVKDEPANVLLDQISAHKAELAKQAKPRGGTSVDSIKQEEVPYELPPTWVWVRFGSIMINRDGERVPVSKEERQTKAKSYDYYGASGVIDKIDGYLFDKPLLLIGEDGANLINRSTPIAFIARGKYWVNNHAHVLDGISEEFLRYIELHINAINLEAYVTGTAQPKMNQAKMNSIPIALPPLAEQKRILAKVDELMALVDQLEAQQQERNRLAEAFAKTCIASFTGTTQLERPEKMKAPKIELVSLVTLGKKPKPDSKAPLAQLLIQNKGTVPAKSLWQQSGLTIDVFYQQLKTEIAQGWIAPPVEAEMKILHEA